MVFNLKFKWWYPLAITVLLALWILLPADTITKTSAEPSPTLVIDAGHGGADGGAVADNGTLESDINLAIALRLEALAGFWGVDTVMTRSGADIDYPAAADTISAMKKADQNARIALINSTPGAVLISIHQNYYPAASPSGIQVFYNTVSSSDALAAAMQANLTARLCPENRRVAEPIDEGIYLMRMAECPSVLVECGFLSNPTECSKLETDSYQTELAAVMLASYLEYIRGISV